MSLHISMTGSWVCTAEILRKDQDPEVAMRRTAASVDELLAILPELEFPQRPYAELKVEQKSADSTSQNTKLMIVSLTADTFLQLFVDILSAVLQKRLVFPLPLTGISACRRNAFYQVDLTFAGYDMTLGENFMKTASEFYQTLKTQKEEFANVDIAINLAAFPPRPVQWRVVSAKNTVDSAKNLIGRRPS